MSEYQYYEFQAVDRPLTRDEMRQLRAVSSRARITPGSFVDEYHWGEFKGNASEWMERFFDGFLFVANWGAREVMLRIPAAVLDVETARRYCPGGVAAADGHGEFVVLSFASHEDPSDLWDEGEMDGRGRLASILPLRAEIAAGDRRALYLAWLLAVQEGEVDDDASEPPLPSGLRELSAAQQAFAAFVRIDSDLVTVAAEASAAPPAEPSAEEAAAALASLPVAEKDALLARVVDGDGARVRLELLRRVRAVRSGGERDGHPPRTAGALLAAADRIADERAQRTREREAAEQGRRAREAAAARDGHLDRLAAREEDAWREVDALIATRQPARYEKAVALVADLRALALREGREADADTRIQRLRDAHANKPSFLKRLQQALGKTV